MNDDELEQYRQMDWVEIAAKVANFAMKEARVRYGWNGNIMAKGKAPDELACEAIAEFWQKPSRFPGTCELTTFLCGIVRQKLWNLSQSKEAQTTHRETEFEDVAELDRTVSPDAAFAMRDDFATVISLLSEHPRVKGKPDHELIITALGCGAFDPDELEKETNLQRSRIYQVQRELADIFPDIRKQLQTKKGA